MGFTTNLELDMVIKDFDFSFQEFKLPYIHTMYLFVKFHY